MRVKIDRQTLLTTLGTNRNQHKIDFDEAWDSYLTLAKKELRKAARDVDKTEKGQSVQVPWGKLGNVPQSHEEDYDRIIGLLQLTNDDEIELDDRDYERYVLDQWDWKDHFAGTTAFYKENAKRR